MKILLGLISSLGMLVSSAQNDTTTFLLHKFAQNIGKEKYTVASSADGTTYTIDFRFVDRGSPVPLKAVLKLKPDLEPISFAIKGNNSRFSVINDTVNISGDNAHVRMGDSAFERTASHTFSVAGYAPGTVQMMMLQYWKKHHRPAKLDILPTGSVEIKFSGYDTLNFKDKTLILERYTVGGLIWGNELVWTDKNGQLYSLITNDAEADKLEMMLEPYESLLPELIRRAAGYSMQLFASTAGRSMGNQGPIAITGGTVVDVVNQKETPNTTVIIENGKIAMVGPAGSTKIPDHAKIIHAEGKFVLPGLWDMHAHFEQAEWGPAYLAAGVTTVRDCGNEFDYINAIQHAIDNGSGVGPHILKAGIIDGKGKFSLGVIQADNEEEAIQAVDRYKDNGFVQIKIYSSVKPVVVKAICTEAHRLGLTVTGHIPEGMNLIQGVDSGMDMVNHIEYVMGVEKMDFKSPRIDFADSTNRSLFAFMKEHHVVIDPTLGVFEMVFRSLKDPITDIEPAFSTLPAPYQAIFVNMGMSPARAKTMKPYMEFAKQTVKALHDNGITIVAGTDQGFPGFSVWRELELYVESGLTPGEALQTATIVPARVMHIDDRFGSVEAGKNADVVIDDADPLVSISNIRKISVVIKDGNVYDPVQLHRMVGFSR
ncbi:MAG TPA: amidohydrolase family protein [Puia sp.]|nr:amidohydrolase family protein [Puia sp.]